MRRSALTATVAATAVALLLTGCGSTEPATTPAGAGAAPAAQPVSVTDARDREVRLDAPAARVVALEWGLAENLVTLGVMPVGVADVKGYTTWVTAEKLAPSVRDVGTRSEPSVDSIVALHPDLVVATTDSAPALLTQLEKYVPVLTLEGNDATRALPTLRDNLSTLATVTGKRDTATRVLADFDAALAAGKREIAAAGAAGSAFTMADGWKEGSSVSIRMYARGSLLSDVATALGLRNAWTSKGDPVYGLAQTDVEGLTALGDVRFLYIASTADGGDVFADGLARNAIWTSLPFVRSGRVHRLPDGIWMFGGPKSATQFVDQVVRVFTS
jgi:ferric hydroxamate transport system substrate-binding protein